jgi:adenine-specific DNA-methyltransferase
MRTNKKTGSYYTPEFLSEFAISYVAPYFNLHENLKVLEPSVGDGSFVKAFNNGKFPSSIKKFSFIGVDKVLPELRKAEIAANTNKRINANYSFIHSDFLKFDSGFNKYSLIIGNPPYIKKSILSKRQISLCEKIHASSGIEQIPVNNLWTSFILKCIGLLDQTGVMALVLPAELLQVNFAKSIRGFISLKFARIEIFTFDDLLFQCKGQDTILLIAYKKSKDPGEFYSHIKNLTQLTSNDFILSKNRSLAITETKWSHHLVSSEDLEFIHRLGKNLFTIDHYCYSKPGIVTAANDFFIIDSKTERRYKLSRYTNPIIKKGFYVNGSVVFDQKNFDQLEASGKPTKVLCFTDNDVKRLSRPVREYLEIGENLDLPYGYKCSKRKNWFVIPNISNIPEGFFFRRTHLYPKLLKNDAKVFVTDSAYKIEMKSGYEINHLIYSFYNSLTLAFTELLGRYYGGGLLELTPNEFKNIPVPYGIINDLDFNSYKIIFEEKENIADILKKNDFNILGDLLQLNNENITRVNNIYKILLTKRLRKK